MPAMPPTLAADDPTVIEAAARVLTAGGVVIVPTETVYGVAALPRVPGATDRLFDLKDRPESVPLAVLVDGLAQAGEVAIFDGEARALAERHWPGPLTLVVRRRPEAASLELGGSADNVGVRCPDDELVRSLARRVGPIATTSANRHGRPTPATAVDAAASLAGGVELVIDGGPRIGVPSTVVDCTGPTLRVLRAGALALEPDGQMLRPSKVFDRVADLYDETRGGVDRGRRAAEVVAPYVIGERVLELGVGTGVVAAALRERGVELAGVDLSRPMLERASQRLGPRVAQADALRLPVGSARIDTVIAVWVLHVIGDPGAALREVGRALRPEGRLIVIEAGSADRPDDDVDAVVGDLHDRLRGETRTLDGSQTIDRVTANGFRLVERTHTPTAELGQTPNALADNFERRVYSSLWDVAPARWKAEVEPVIAALRALPEPDRRRPQAARHHVLVFERT